MLATTHRGKNHHQSLLERTTRIGASGAIVQRPSATRRGKRPIAPPKLNIKSVVYVYMWIKNTGDTTKALVPKGFGLHSQGTEHILPFGRRVSHAAPGPENARRCPLPHRQNEHLRDHSTMVGKRSHSTPGSLGSQARFCSK